MPKAPFTRIEVKRWTDAGREVGVLLITFAPLDFAYQFKSDQSIGWQYLMPLAVAAGGFLLIRAAISVEEKYGGFDD